MRFREMDSCGLGQGQVLFSCEHGTELPGSLKCEYSWLAHELFTFQKRTLLLWVKWRTSVKEHILKFRKVVIPISFDFKFHVGEQIFNSSPSLFDTPLFSRLSSTFIPLQTYLGLHFSAPWYQCWILLLSLSLLNFCLFPLSLDILSLFFSQAVVTYSSLVRLRHTASLFWSSRFLDRDRWCTRCGY